MIKFHRYFTSNCRGRLIIRNGVDSVESQAHSHPPDARSVNKANVLQTIKEKAKIDKRNARDIVVEACGAAELPTIPVLPTVKNLIRAAKKQQNGFNAHVNPKTLADLILNESNVTTSNGQNFLLYDSANDSNNVNERLIIFGTTENLKTLKSCEAIAMDGTFKLVPPLFKQLFTIHGSYMHAFVVTTYAFNVSKFTI